MERWRRCRRGRRRRLVRPGRPARHRLRPGWLVRLLRAACRLQPVRSVQLARQATRGSAWPSRVAPRPCAPTTPGDDAPAARCPGPPAPAAPTTNPRPGRTGRGCRCGGCRRRWCGRRGAVPPPEPTRPPLASPRLPPATCRPGVPLPPVAPAVNTPLSPLLSPPPPVAPLRPHSSRARYPVTLHNHVRVRPREPERAHSRSHRATHLRPRRRLRRHP